MGHSLNSRKNFKMVPTVLPEQDGIFWHPRLKVKIKVSCSVVSDSLRLPGLQSARLLCPRNSPGKNTGVGCYFLFQVIFPTQRSNPGLPRCRQTLYHLSHQGSHSFAWARWYFLVSRIGLINSIKSKHLWCISMHPGRQRFKFWLCNFLLM